MKITHHLIASTMMLITPLIALFLLGILSASAANIDNPYLFVTNSYNGTVSIININNNSFESNIQSGDTPRNIIINSAGTYAYVVNYITPSTVSVISLNTNSIIKTISVGGDPRSININPSGTKIYIADPTNSKIYVIDTVTYSLSNITMPGYSPFQTVFSNNGNELWVGSETGHTLVIDPSTGSITHTITTGTANSIYSSIAISLDGSNIYVADTELSPGVSHLYKIDTGTYSIIATLNQSADTAPYLVKVDINGNVWECLGNSNKVSKIDSSLSYVNNVTATLPSAITVSNNHVYVLTSSSNVTVIDTNSVTVIDTINVGNGAWDVIIGNIAPENIPVAPHLTLFRVQSFFGIVTYSNVSVTVSYTMNNEILYTGLTDDTGSYSCILYPSQQYTIHFVNATQGIDETLTIYPVDTAYYVNVLPLPGFDISNLFLNGSSQNIETGQSWALNLTSNVGTIYTTYEDYGNTSSSVNFSLYSKNPLANTPPVYVSSNVYTPLQPNINVLSFNGMSSYVNVDGSGGVYNSPGGVYSVEAIVKATSSGSFEIIYGEAQNTAGTTPCFMFRKDNNDKASVFIRFDDLTAISINGTSSINDGVPHRVSWVDNNGVYMLYVDGVVEAGGTYTRKALTLNTTTVGALKRDTYQFFYSGIISDVRLWTTARTEAQVNDDMFIRLTGSESGLKAYYKLDEGTGTTANDLTSNNYDGTINAGTWTTATLRQYLRNVYSISNAGGKEYLVTVNGTSSLYGDNSHSYGVTFPGATVTIGEIPQDWYQWLSFLIILIIAGLGTAVTGPITLIAVALCAIIFGAFGWFNPLSSWAMDGAISLTFLMGLGWYIIQKEREG